METVFIKWIDSKTEVLFQKVSDWIPNLKFEKESCLYSNCLSPYWINEILFKKCLSKYFRTQKDEWVSVKIKQKSVSYFWSLPRNLKLTPWRDSNCFSPYWINKILFKKCLSKYFRTQEDEWVSVKIKRKSVSFLGSLPRSDRQHSYTEQEKRRQDS